LEYSAHPHAEQILFEVLAQVAVTAPGVRAIAASHRIGSLQIGDAALVAAVSAGHRAAAFDTCARLVDAVKERLPVWKHQFFADGTDEWVNSA
jgi:molybdopterin synthase catalytic subunit